LEAVLVLIFTITASAENNIVELRLTKHSYEQCIADADEFRHVPGVMRNLVNVEVRCERIGRAKARQHELA